jgi:hypothetical protein
MEPLTADRLAEILHEPKRFLLQRVLRTVGQDMAADVLVLTLQCEANGGMLTKDRTRRRTPGGTFFALMKERVTEQQRWRLFPPTAAYLRQQRPQAPQAPTWEEVRALIKQLTTTRAGEARIMKLTLIGRPGKIEIRKDCVLLRMQGKAPTNFPKGLPPVPKQAPLTWTVLVALRQWNRVKESVTTNQDDQLLIEGYPTREGNELVLMAQSCTSVAQQRARKAAQEAQ